MMITMHTTPLYCFFFPFYFLFFRLTRMMWACVYASSVLGPTFVDDVVACSALYLSENGLLLLELLAREVNKS